MAFRSLSQIFRRISHFKAKYYVSSPSGARRYAKQVCAETCEKEKKGKGPSWSFLALQKFRRARGDDEPTPEKCVDDPDLSAFGGKAFRTCGPAYVIQYDTFPIHSLELTAEEKILKKIEAHFENKDKLDDPMPPYTNAAQRMVDLCNNKLHPFYKRYQNLPRRKVKMCQQKLWSDPTEIPLQIRMNKDLLGAKNMYIHYKRIDPPGPIRATSHRMRASKVPIQLPDSATTGKKRAVFDTLHQKDLKF